MIAHHPFSSTILSSSVISDHYSLVDGAEECCPVNGVIITQVAVVSNVDVARTDFLQRLELQGSDTLLFEDKQRETTVEDSPSNGDEVGENTEICHIWRPRLYVQETCYFSDRPKDIQFLWVYGFNCIVRVPVNPGDKEDEIPIDLCTVYEFVNVTGIHSLG